MGNAEATPRPWDYVPSTEHHGPYITSDYGGTIADLYLMSEPGEPSIRNGGRSRPVHFFGEMADPNAELIVRAVNAHDALVAALEFYTNPKNWIDSPSWDGDPQCFTPGAVPVSDDEDGRPCDCGSVARAALRLVKHCSSQVEPAQ